MNVNDMVAAMAAKTVDAMVNVEPYNAIAVAEGIGTSLMDFSGYDRDPGVHGGDPRFRRQAPRHCHCLPQGVAGGGTATSGTIPARSPMSSTPSSPRRVTTCRARPSPPRWRGSRSIPASPGPGAGPAARRRAPAAREEDLRDPGLEEGAAARPLGEGQGLQSASRSPREALAPTYEVACRWVDRAAKPEHAALSMENGMKGAKAKKVAEKRTRSVPARGKRRSAKAPAARPRGCCKKPARRQRPTGHLELQAAQSPYARWLRRHGRGHVDPDCARRPPHPVAGARKRAEEFHRRRRVRSAQAQGRGADRPAAGLHALQFAGDLRKPDGGRLPDAAQGATARRHGVVRHLAAGTSALDLVLRLLRTALARRASALVLRWRIRALRVRRARLHAHASQRRSVLPLHRRA